MKKASIDLGTNTCLLFLAEWDEGRKQISKVVGDFSKIVRLGEGVDQSRHLQPAAMTRTLECLKGYAARVQAAGLSPQDTICVATSQARDAKNSSEFFSKVKAETGFSFKTLTGEEEAQFTFLGALLPGMDPRHSHVIDIGGGSTEIISWNQAQSVDMGSVRFTERFFKSDPVTDPEFWSCQEEIDRMLEKFRPWRNNLPQNDLLIAVAGSATTLAAWFLELPVFDPQKVDSLVLSRGDLHRRVEELKWRTVEERKQLPGIEADRADVILAGALILWRTLEVLGFPECRISTRGLRYGVLTEGSSSGQ